MLLPENMFRQMVSNSFIFIAKRIHRYKTIYSGINYFFIYINEKLGFTGNWKHKNSTQERKCSIT